MNSLQEDFDPIQFPSRMSWMRRVATWITNQESKETNPFIDANANEISGILNNDESGVCMVVNMPAAALLKFFKDNRYKNAYERPEVAGLSSNSSNSVKPSETRIHVDQLLGFKNDANKYYFGAVALGGTGVRFYGEYCIVLDPDSIAKSTKIFDRNSYDLIRPPLSDMDNKEKLVKCLQGTWARDLIYILMLKILPSLISKHRLITTGTVSDAILNDEDFVEVHRKKTFTTKDVKEIRKSPEDEVMQNDIYQKMHSQRLPSLSEILWSSRRALIEEELHSAGIKSRIITTTGRGNRWR